MKRKMNAEVAKRRQELAEANAKVLQHVQELEEQAQKIEPINQSFDMVGLTRYTAIFPSEAAALAGF